MRITLQPAYVLHNRAYRDSSLLLEIFTPEYGRLSLVARGARRRARGGSVAALLQPFQPLLLSFAGRSEMKTLTASEAAGSPLTLRGEQLFSALYVNELLVRLLHRHDAHPGLFGAYADVLGALSSGAAAEGALRRFELVLLDELGYTLQLAVDGLRGEPVLAECRYHYDPGCGLVPLAVGEESRHASYAGADLLAMAAGEFEGAARLPARRLLREALAHQLGEAPLRSRELFQARAGRRRDSPLEEGETGP